MAAITNNKTTCCELNKRTNLVVLMNGFGQIKNREPSVLYSQDFFNQPTRCFKVLLLFLNAPLLFRTPW